jgi:hypothetical protein
MKHGLPTLRILEVDPVDLDAAEMAWIAAFRGRGLQLLNCTNGGDGQRGLVHTPEARAKIGAASRSLVRTDEHRERQRQARSRQAPHRHTAATRAKMSATRRGVPHSPEHIAKIVESRRRNAALRNAAW